MTSMNLIKLEKNAAVGDLIADLQNRFSQGADMVSLVNDGCVVGTVLSPNEAKRAMAKRIAKRLVADPGMLRELAEGLKQEPEDW